MSNPFHFATDAHGRRGATSELPFALPLELNVEDPDTIAELSQYADGEDRERFALNALRIGVLALRQARGQIDGEQIRRESQLLLKSLESHLTAHASSVHERLTGALKDYFDPESGRFQERVNRLIRKDGELEELLRRQVGGNGSELSRTLSAHFGAESPLFKLLSPTESAGLMKALRDTLDDQLKDQRDRILNEFSLNNKEGALSRLVCELTDNQGKLTDCLQEKIAGVVRELSLDEENSALNRLVKNVEGAQKTITSEFSLDNESSALCRLKKLLESTQQAIDSNLTLDSDSSSLARLRKEVLEILEKHSQTNQSFQTEVRVTLEKMVVQRAEAARSTRHGLIFEDVVCEFLAQEARKLGDIATRTGDTVGSIRNCKVGDCLIELGPESAAPQARVVIEAKEKGNYQLSQAREEIELARKNRGAQIGLFVYSTRLAPAELTASPVLRYGDDVFVVWDPEDPNTDLFLRTALTLVRALCVRAAHRGDERQADFEALDEAILEIERRTDGLSEIEIAAKSIQGSSEKILKRVELSRKALTQQVETLRETLTELRHLLPEPAGGK